MVSKQKKKVKASTPKKAKQTKKIIEVKQVATSTPTYLYAQGKPFNNEEILQVVPKGIVFEVLSSEKDGRVKVRSINSPFVYGYIKANDLKVP